MNNLNHDLIHQLSEALDSQWRFDIYLKEANSAGCKDCQNLWHNMKKRYEEIEKALMTEINRHITAGMFEK